VACGSPLPQRAGARHHLCVKSCEIREVDGVPSVTGHAVSVVLPVQQEVGRAQEYSLKHFAAQSEKSSSEWERRQFSCVVAGLISSTQQGQG